jgi:GDP-L-fucose synthase
MHQKIYDLAGRRIWVAGHTGLVGGALLRRLASTGGVLLTADRATLDLRKQAPVEQWLAANRPDAIFLAAATVGGIEANRTRPAEFLYDNLMIAANVIHAAAENGVSKLMFLGSSCFYPRNAGQPIREDTLLTGAFEPTNEWYAVSKIAGAKLCQAYRRQHGKDFITAVPTNLYGPGDNFDVAAGHVIPGLICRIHEAKQANAESVEIWGTGRPEREFLYVDDAADAMVFLMERYTGEEMINIAGGEIVSIAELTRLIADEIGYRGAFRFDTLRPDGMPRKVLDSTRIRNYGWQPATSFRQGLSKTYTWLVANSADARGYPRGTSHLGQAILPGAKPPGRL